MSTFPSFSFCQDFSEKNYGQTFSFQYDSEVIQTEFFFTAVSFAFLKEKAASFLHPQELDALSKFQYEKKQQTYLLGRYAAKNALSRYDTQEIPSTSLWVDSGIFNHPIVYHLGKSNVQVTLSHCNDKAVALVFPESFPMGIDIEGIHQDKTDGINSQLTHHEKQLLQNLAHTCSSTTYILFWTLKEALSKALRIGFLSSPHLYEIEEIQLTGHHFTGTFTNFPQYQGLCFHNQSFVISLVFPMQSYLLTEKALECLI